MAIEIPQRFIRKKTELVDFFLLPRFTKGALSGPDTWKPLWLLAEATLATSAICCTRSLVGATTWRKIHISGSSKTIKIEESQDFHLNVSGLRKENNVCPSSWGSFCKVSHVSVSPYVPQSQSRFSHVHTTWDAGQSTSSLYRTDLRRERGVAAKAKDRPRFCQNLKRKQQIHQNTAVAHLQNVPQIFFGARSCIC